MVRQVAVNNTSFDRAGITTDSKDAICEYIWNGFEAGAKKVVVQQTGLQLRESQSIQVIDDGKGIEYETIEETFGAFLSSVKDSASIRIKSQANKGKGRFSYMCFSPSAEWSTIYEKDGALKKYAISMSSHSKKDYSTSDVVDATGELVTGTVVDFPISDSKVEDQLSYANMHQKLMQEFSWFLYLHKNSNYSLEYMGTILDYNHYINAELSIDCTTEIEGETFQINLIVWKKSIDNSSMIYYLSENGEIYHAATTGFNKNTVDFYHNVFVTSAYINSQNSAHLNSENSAQISLNELQDKQKKISGQLKKEIHALIVEALKKFLILQADEKLNYMAERGSLPKFPDDEYGQLRKKDFETVTRELYCAEPRIFYKLTDEQAKSLLGFLNLLLGSDERENLLTIIEHVVNLTAEQRKTFADILQRTKLQYILDAISTIDRRLAAIEQLKTIIFDLTKFANERDHIQEIVERHFWLFGEQYHMLTSDKALATSLAEFENITHANSQDEAKLKSKRRTKAGKAKDGMNQRADIFLYTQNTPEDGISEMLVIELKAPSVKLSLDVYNQIVNYANTIRKEPRFSGANQVWRFFAVCASVDDDVKTKYKNFKALGKNGLVEVIENFEIYALTWADVFQSFESRHSTMLKKLKIDYTQAFSALGLSEDTAPSRGMVNELCNKLVDPPV
jgi:hypothetical protein